MTLAGCGGDRPPPATPTPDLGMRDAGEHDGDVVDATLFDGEFSDAYTLDGAPPDDGGLETDGFIFDAAGFDLGVPPPFDLGPDGWAPVETPDFGPPGDLGRPGGDSGIACPRGCTTDSECGPGSVCVPGGCGGPTARHCEHAGAECATMLPCNLGEVCAVVGGVNLCVPTAAGVECVTSLSCAAGFACETDGGGVKHCVNRRKQCFATAGGCPTGFICAPGVTGAQPYCRRTLRTCTMAGECAAGSGERCVDLQGDGALECTLPAGDCDTNASCTVTAAPTCETSYASGRLICGRTGLCRNAGDCPSGYLCTDVHGDGYTACHPSAGCQSDTNCPAPALCIDTGAGDATCLDS